MKNLLKKFKFRNLIYNTTKNIHLFKKKNYFYFGIDPNYSSLHIGHLLGISLINRLYKLGYKNLIIILGGATSLIGDIKNKNKKNKHKILKNIKLIKNQLYKIIKNKQILILNNIKWLKKIKLLKFLLKILKKISINSILKIKIIKKKLNNNKNIKFTEFIYHILQGYDYLYLNNKFKCSLQIGGADQWNNIITGIKLIKKIKNKKVHGFTFPLLLNSKGIKFSKSNKNIKNIWIDKNKTSIYKLYQYLINLSDKEAINYFKQFSYLNIKKIKKTILIHNKFKHKKYLQKYLVKYFISWIHNKKTYYEIISVMNILFKKKIKIKYIIKNIKLIKKYIKNINININPNKTFTIYNIIAKNKIIFKSNTEYKNFIKNNGILLINCQQIYNHIINLNNLIYNKYLLFQKGKKKFFLLNLKYK
ncbi:MAG: tyrosine--tRNA ligase [Candidatus Shikimatogenerans bostrichidophilus]|nr:MAG: tyrosine--tRNA ligase [Candidatus Shikimatogenerans bostrichidophilus]